MRERVRTISSQGMMDRNSASLMSRLCAVAVIVYNSRWFVSILSSIVAVLPLLQVFTISIVVTIEMGDSVGAIQERKVKLVSILDRFTFDDEYSYNYSIVITSAIEIVLFLLCLPHYFSSRATEFQVFRFGHLFYFAYLLYSRLNFSWSISHFIKGIFLYEKSVITFPKIILSLISLILTAISISIDNILAACNVIITGTTFEKKIYSMAPDIAYATIFVCHELVCCIGTKWIRTCFLVVMGLSFSYVLFSKRFVYSSNSRRFNSFALSIILYDIIFSFVSIYNIWKGIKSELTIISTLCYIFSLYALVDVIMILIENDRVERTLADLETDEPLKEVKNPYEFIGIVTMYQITREQKLILLSKGLEYFPGNFEMAISYSKFSLDERKSLEILNSRNRKTNFHLVYIHVFKSLCKKDLYGRGVYLKTLDVTVKLTKECFRCYYMLFSEILVSRPDRIISLNIECYRRSEELAQIMKNLYYGYQDNDEFKELVDVVEKVSFKNIKNQNNEGVIGENKVHNDDNHAIAKKFYDRYRAPVFILQLIVFVMPFIIYLLCAISLLFIVFSNNSSQNSGIESAAMLTRMCENLSLVNYATLIGPRLQFYNNLSIQDYLTGIFHTALNNVGCDVMSIYKDSTLDFAQYDDHMKSLRNPFMTNDDDDDNIVFDYYDTAGNSSQLDVISFYLKIFLDSLVLVNQTDISIEEQFFLLNNSMTLFNELYKVTKKASPSFLTSIVQNSMDKYTKIEKNNRITSIVLYLFGLLACFVLHRLYAKIVWYEFVVPKSKIYEHIDELNNYLDLNLSISEARRPSQNEYLRNILLQTPVHMLPTYHDRNFLVVCYYVSMFIFTGFLFHLAIDKISVNDVKIVSAVSNMYDTITLTGNVIMLTPLSMHFVFNNDENITEHIKVVLKAIKRNLKAIYLINDNSLMKESSEFAEVKTERGFTHEFISAVDLMYVLVSKLAATNYSLNERKIALARIIKLSAQFINNSIPGFLNDQLNDALTVQKSTSFTNFQGCMFFIITPIILFYIFSVILYKHFTFSDFLKTISLFLEGIVENPADFFDNPQLDVNFDCKSAVTFDNHCADGIMDPTFFLDDNDIIQYVSPSAKEMLDSQSIEVGVTNAIEYFPKIGFDYTHNSTKSLENNKKTAKMSIIKSSFTYFNANIVRVCVIIDDSRVITLERRASIESSIKNIVEASLKPANYNYEAPQCYKHAVIAFFRVDPDISSDEIIPLKTHIIEVANKYEGMQMFCRSLSFFRVACTVPSGDLVASYVDSMVKFASELSLYFSENKINSSVCISLAENVITDVVMKTYNAQGIDQTKKYPNFEFLCSGISANFEGLITTNVPNCVALTKSALEAVYDLGYDVSPFNFSSSNSGSRTLYKINSYE